MKDYTTEEIHRLNFLREVEFSLQSVRYPCPEAEIIQAIIPKDTGEQWKACIDWCISQAQTMEIQELEKFYNTLPGGYLRMRVDYIMEKRTGDKE